MLPREPNEALHTKADVTKDRKAPLSIGVSLRGNKPTSPAISNDEEDFDVIIKKKTDFVLREMEQDSELFRGQPPTRRLPHFHVKELQLSEVIGSGEFGEVCSVLAIQDFFGNFGSATASAISQKMPAKSPPVSAKKRYMNLVRDGTQPDAEDSLANEIRPEDMRAFMSQRCFRGSVPRYAIKRIASLCSADLKAESIMDLAAEAKFLAHVEHSNIIKLRATVGTPGTEGFMVMMDQLVEILDKQVLEWKQADSKYKRNGLFRFKNSTSNKMARKDLATERLVAMFDVARALRYLHSRKILFRDLKPE